MTQVDFPWPIPRLGQKVSIDVYDEQGEIIGFEDKWMVVQMPWGGSIYATYRSESGAHNYIMSHD